MISCYARAHSGTHAEAPKQRTHIYDDFLASQPAGEGEGKVGKKALVSDRWWGFDRAARKRKGIKKTPQWSLGYGSVTFPSSLPFFFPRPRRLSLSAHSLAEVRTKTGWATGRVGWLGVCSCVRQCPKIGSFSFSFSSILKSGKRNENQHERTCQVCNVIYCGL